jgi:hypothetical protein
MKRFSTLGWLVAAVVLVLNATATLAAPTAGNPLEGHLLQHSSGALYLYRAGQRFSIQIADVGDGVINAIPMASQVEWQTLLSNTPGAPGVSPPIPEQPAPANS